jgi:uncharacterized protein YfaS (alpha-2-macroglobulin family)
MKDLPAKTKTDGVELVKDILNSNGDIIKTAKLGDEVTVRIRVKSTKKEYINDVAVVDLVPGCFETVGASVSVNNGYLDSSEIREERAIFYLSATKDMKEITYKAKIIAKGDFVVPPTYGTALYDSDVRANTKAGTIKISE